MTPTPHNHRARWPISFGYFTVLAVFGAVMAAWGPSLPNLTEQLHTDLSKIGLIFTIISLGFIVTSSLAAPRIYDRIPGNPALAVGLLMMALVMALVPSMPTFLLLTPLLLVLGSANALLVVGTNTMLAWEHQDNVAPWLNAMNFFNGVGALLAPIIVAQVLAASGSIAWAFRILAMMAAGTAVWLLFLPSPSPQGGSAQSEKSRSVNYRLLALIAALFLLYVGAERSFGNWLYTYSLAVHSLTETIAGYLTAAFWGALTAGRLLAIPIAGRISPRKILLVTFPGGVLSLALILSLPESLPALWAGSIGLGLCMASIFPSLMSYADQRIKLSGRITGILVSSASIGGMTFPWLSGQLFESRGPNTTMLMIFILMLLASMLFLGNCLRRRVTAR